MASSLSPPGAELPATELAPPLPGVAVAEAPAGLCAFEALEGAEPPLGAAGPCYNEAAVAV
jgi:hypothetical protein